jgi:oleate hydratase
MSAAPSTFYLVGGGIASLAAAAFLIRDGKIAGSNIVVLEQSDRLGGSLDGSGSAEQGYVIRGGRMLESKYVCTFDLFASIPTLAGDKSVTDEIFAWNEKAKTCSRSRLIRNGHSIDEPEFVLTETHILKLEWLALEPELLLGRSSIAAHFAPDFFETNFWIMWCTTFAFQPWHGAVEFRRYLLRFSHMVVGFNQLRGIMRTVLNQYDSMVRPLESWLQAQGVRFEPGCCVVDLVIDRSDAFNFRVERIIYLREGSIHEFAVGKQDFVIATLGSMTAASSLGSTDVVPALKGKADSGSWKLWETLARDRPEFGRPATFSDHTEQSRWISFTVTLRDPVFFELVQAQTTNLPGEGGLITFADSPWLLSIVLPHQPHFIDQPEDVQVFWGYALKVDEPGKFVDKPMSACNGKEILTEVLGHFRRAEETQRILDSSICIPCMMPFITSQFLQRSPGDRPKVVPEGSRNLAFVGQFCELPDDVVFTVEYSVRSAGTAVYELLKLDRHMPGVYKGQHHLRVLLGAYRALHDLGG